jgi:hypothetical protein
MVSLQLACPELAEQEAFGGSHTVTANGMPEQTLKRRLDHAIDAVDAALTFKSPPVAHKKA